DNGFPRIEVFHQLLGDLVLDILPIHDIIAFQGHKIARDIDRFDKGKVNQLLGQGGVLCLVDVFVFVIPLDQKMVGLQLDDLGIVGGHYGDVVFFHIENFVQKY